MPRMAREKSSTGVYHVMVRGINQQNIFEDDEDRQRFTGLTRGTVLCVDEVMIV